MAQAQDIDIEKLQDTLEEQSMTVLKLQHPAIAEDLATFERKTDKLAEITERIDDLREQRDRHREEVTELADRLLEQLDE